VDAHGLGLDRDAPLPFQVHAVQELLSHLPVADGPGELQEPIGEGRLAVIDVRDDREVADELLRMGHVVLVFP